MDLSGVIFVVLALAWAGFLIPKALKHHDEVAKTRSVDRFSSAMRVVARREAVSSKDARLVVTPPAAAPASAVRDAAEERSAVRAAAVPPVARRRAAAAAARRRRRVLLLLVLVSAIVGVAAYLGHLPLYAPAVPAGLTVAYLVLCAVLGKRERAARARRRAHAAAAPRPASEATAGGAPAAGEVAASAAPVRAANGPSGSPAVVGPAAVVEVPAQPVPSQPTRNEHGFTEISPSEETVAIPASALSAVAVPATDEGTLWDPLPMTLPTYVTKPRARRTVRTIDLHDPSVSSSGRDAEASRLVAQAEALEAEAATSPARAVGS